MCCKKASNEKDKENRLSRQNFFVDCLLIFNGSIFMSYHFVHSGKCFIKNYSATDFMHSQTWEVGDRGWLYNWFDRRVAFVPMRGERENFSFFEPVFANDYVKSIAVNRKRMLKVDVGPYHARLIRKAKLNRKPVVVSTSEEIVLYFCEYGKRCRVALRFNNDPKIK